MINLPAIYIANGTGILLLFIILLTLKRPPCHGLFEEKVFYAMVGLNILQCLIESAVFFMDGKMAYGNHTLLIVLNDLLFMNNIVFAYSWTMYLDYKLFADIKRIRRIYPFVAIPAALIIIGCAINLATPVFFAVDQNNMYQRTDLFIVPYAVTYLYLAYGVILAYSYRKKVDKYLFLPVIQFMIPVIIGSLLQFFFYGYSLVWLGVSIGMISLFINVQNEASYVDVLSGLYNRQYLNNILLIHSNKRDTARALAGIMLDIDDFKSINDRFGHTVGDDAISAVGKILHKAVGNKGILCRYGGDEFIVLIYINSQKEIMDTIDSIKTQTTRFNESEEKPYKINFSIGCGTYENKDAPHVSIDNFLRKVDASMYENKKRRIDARILSDRRQNG